MASAFALVCAAGAARSQEVDPYQPARTAVERAADTPARLRAMFVHASLLASHDLALCETATTAGLDAARAAGDRSMAALFLALRARRLAKVVGRDACFAALAAADEGMSAEASPWARARLDYAVAVCRQLFGDRSTALERLDLAIDAADQGADRGFAAFCRLTALFVTDVPDEDVTPEIERMAQAFDGPEAVQQRLRARLLLVHANRRYGRDLEAIEDLADLVAAAAAAGDRNVESLAARMLGQMQAATDLDTAQATLARSVAVARTLGDRELVGFALHGLAECEVRRGRGPEASAAITEALDSFAALGLESRLYSAMNTALRAAALVGDRDRVKVLGEQMVAIERSISAASRNGNDVARYWREADALRRTARDAEQSHRAELQAVHADVGRVSRMAGAAVIALLSLVSGLLFLGTRRLRRLNRTLGQQIAATDREREAREALEENLRQIERLDSLGLMAGGFAHDFNNILAVVVANAELLATQGGLAAADQQSVAQIRSAAARAAALCRDILAYARSGSCDRAVVDLREVLDGLAPIARAGFGSGVDLRLSLGAGPAAAAVDRAQIEQVFLNMLVNAGEAVGERGIIRVAIGRRQLPAAPPSGHWFGKFADEERECVAVAISDTGHGMDAATIHRVFDPFFSTRFAGRGLGLAVSFGILQRHGGVVHVESSIGAGTTFTVYLPEAAHEARVADRVPESPTPGLNGVRRVLVVDDESAVRDVMRRLLEREGLQIVEAGSAAAALQALEGDEGFDLALLDYTMPDTDGPSLLRALRERRPGLRAVLMSGHDERWIRSVAPDCGFLAKPFDRLTVLRALGEPSGAQADRR